MIGGLVCLAWRQGNEKGRFEASLKVIKHFVCGAKGIDVCYMVMATLM